MALLGADDCSMNICGLRCLRKKARIDGCSCQQQDRQCAAHQTNGHAINVFFHDAFSFSTRRTRGHCSAAARLFLAPGPLYRPAAAIHSPGKEKSLGRTHPRLHCLSALYDSPFFSFCQEQNERISFLFFALFRQNLQMDNFCVRSCFHKQGAPDDENFCTQPRRFSAAILTDRKGIQRRMGAKRSSGRCAMLIKTASYT